MTNLEKVTGFIVALGALLTAATNLYKEYNAQTEKQKKN